MCPHYERLKNIFGEKRAVEAEVFDSSITSGDFFGFIDIGDEILVQNEDTAPLFSTETFENETSQPGISQQVTSQPETSQLEISQPEIAANPRKSGTVERVTALAEKFKKSASKDSLSQLAKCQTERNNTQRLKIKFEEEKFQKEHEFQKVKFQAELEVLKQNLELKKI